MDEQDGTVEYINAEQLAIKLGVGLKAVRKWTCQDRLPGVLRISRRCIRYHLPTLERAMLAGRLLREPANLERG